MFESLLVREEIGLDGSIESTYGRYLGDRQGEAMDLEREPRQPVKETVGSLEPSHLWVLGQAVGDDGSLVGPRRGPYSYQAECECPDDCLRDHESE